MTGLSEESEAKRWWGNSPGFAQLVGIADWARLGNASETAAPREDGGQLTAGVKPLILVAFDGRSDRVYVVPLPCFFGELVS
jgi:hypothetical protein